MQKLFSGSSYQQLHLFLTGLKSCPHRCKPNACKHLWLRMLQICLKWPLCGCIKLQRLLQGIHESECGYLLWFFMYQHPQDSPVLTHLSFWLIQNINPGDPTGIIWIWQEFVKYKTEQVFENPCLTSPGKINMKFEGPWKHWLMKEDTLTFWLWYILIIWGKQLYEK